jgi:LysM repeat protein
MKARYMTHTVNPGDTIQSIGATYNVDWTKLVIVNGLMYPFIDSEINSHEFDNTDEVAKIGSRLVIPTTGIHIPKKTNNLSEELENYTFGCDLDLYSTETSYNGVTNLEALGVLNAGSDGDILLSEGINNLRQQLITRLGTPKGTLMMHPEWGCNLINMIGGKVTMERLIKIKLEVQECVLGDFRVLGVSDIRAVFKNSDGADGSNGILNSHGRAIFIDFIVHPVEPYSVFRVGKTFSR